MTLKPKNRRALNALAAAAPTAAVGVASLVPAIAQVKEVTLLNVSYDPPRELYQQYNVALAKYWKAQTGHTRGLHGC